MRIAVVSSSWGAPWSEGVRNLARSVRQGLRSMGHETEVLHPALAVQTKETPRNLPSLPRAMHGIRFVADVRRRLETGSYDAALWFTSLSSWYGVKRQLLERSGTPIVPFVTGLRRTLAGYSSPGGRSPIVISPFLQQQFFPQSTFVPPLLPVHVQRNSQFVRRLPQPPFNILFLGAFERARGVEHLLQAMLRLDDRFRLTMAFNGKGAPSAALRRMLAALQGQARLDLLGSVDTVKQYAGADVLVIPRVLQTRMTFPVRIIEALHMRLPIIVSDIVGMGQAVGPAGIAVPPRNAASLAAAIKELLTGQNAYRRAVDGCGIQEAEFQTDRSVARISEVLENVAA